MILLWGIAGDDPLDRVRAELDAAGTRYRLLDQQAVGETSVDLVLDGTLPRGTLSSRGWSVQLEAVTAVYARPYDSRRMVSVRETPPGSPERLHCAALDDALLSWLESTPALVLNRPSAMASNTSKPYQTTLMAAAGAAVPETLVTTVREAVEEFAAEREAVVYKSVSGVRSIVSRLSRRPASHLDDLSCCPTQFQEYVPGVDVRVHVVGDRVFATEIRTDAGADVDDYRYGSAALHATEPTAAERRQCLALSRALDLPLAGIDLRRTPAGASVYFEVNPSPGFSYYEAATGQPIAAAIADLLASGARPCLRGAVAAVASAP